MASFQSPGGGASPGGGGGSSSQGSAPAILPKSPLDLPLSSRRKEVSLSAFSLVFSELVQHQRARVESINDLEARLEASGRDVGARLGEALAARERPGKRETRLITMLQFVSGPCWRVLFGRAADSLERSTENEDEYLIHDRTPITNTYVSVPPDLGQLNCAAYIAGIVGGILEASGFESRCSAHHLSVEDGESAGAASERTVIVIRFLNLNERQR